MDAPKGNIRIELQLTARQTDIPASDQDPIIVKATGTTPPLVFRQPGHATVTIGNSLDAHIILRDASGNLAEPGEVHPTCTLDPDQDPRVYSFDIISPAAAPTTTPTAEMSGPTTSPLESPDGTGPPKPIPPDPSDPPSSETGSTATSTTVSEAPAPTVPPTTTPPDDRHLIPVVFWTYGGWLVAAIVIAGAGVIGGAWWLQRRRG